MPPGMHYRNRWFNRACSSNYRSRCGPCHTIAPAYEALAKQYTNVNFLKCDVDAAQEVAGRYSISAM